MASEQASIQAFNRLSQPGRKLFWRPIELLGKLIPGDPPEFVDVTWVWIEFAVILS